MVVDPFVGRYRRKLRLKDAAPRSSAPYRRQIQESWRSEPAVAGCAMRALLMRIWLCICLSSQVLFFVRSLPLREWMHPHCFAFCEGTFACLTGKCRASFASFCYWLIFRFLLEQRVSLHVSQLLHTSHMFCRKHGARGTCMPPTLSKSLRGRYRVESWRVPHETSGLLQQVSHRTVYCRNRATRRARVRCCDC